MAALLVSSVFIQTVAFAPLALENIIMAGTTTEEV
jgi:hypothetical protein